MTITISTVRDGEWSFANAEYRFDSNEGRQLLTVSNPATKAVFNWENVICIHTVPEGVDS